MEKGNFGPLSPKKGEVVPVTVENMEPLSGNRWKVKIKETGLGLLDMNHDGRKFVTIKDYGRGRYIMKLTEDSVPAALDKEWEAVK